MEYSKVMNPNILVPPKPIDYIFSNSFTKPTLRNIQEHLLYIYEKCPVCNKSQNVLYGYQHRVCLACLVKYYIYDGSQNRILIGNLGIAGGIQVFQLLEDNSGNLTKHEETYSQTRECYINGIKCVASECKYGGIIIQG